MPKDPKMMTGPELELFAQTILGMQFAKNFKREVTRPASGWLRSIRKLYKLKLIDAAKLRNVATQVQAAAERAEAEERITLGTLRSVADAMGFDLVYGLAPRADIPDIYLASVTGVPFVAEVKNFSDLASKKLRKALPTKEASKKAERKPLKPPTDSRKRTPALAKAQSGPRSRKAKS